MAPYSWDNMTEGDLLIAHAQHARMPEDSAHRPRADFLHHLHALAAIIRFYNLEDNVGLHLLHRHFALPPRTVVLGIRHTEPTPAWIAAPTPFEDLKVDFIRPHNLCVVDGIVRPYEFRAGKWDGLSIDAKFWADVASYMELHKIEHTLGLQILSGHCSYASEVAFPNCTVMLDMDSAPSGPFEIGTGWRAAPGGVGLTMWETHHEEEDGGHNKVNMGALGTVWELEKLLKDMGFPW